jgi:hypothetical protein
MTRRAAVGVCILSVILTLISVLTYGALIPKVDEYKIDTSWISKLEEYLIETQPYPAPPGDWDLSSHFVYLYDDGQEQLVEYSCGGTNLVTFLENVTDKAYVKTSVEVDEGLISRIMASGRAVCLTYRYPSFSSSSTQLNKAWFILQDKLGEGLIGSVVLDQTINNNKELSIWAIAK